MSQEDGGQDREHEATPQKLIEARKHGDVPRSTDLLAAAGIAGFLLALFTMGAWVVDRAGAAGVVLLDQSISLSQMAASGAEGQLAGFLLAFAGPPLALLGLPPLLVLATLVVTRGAVFTPGNLAPKLSRISPLAAARQKFGTEGLISFLKSTLKLCIFSGILYSFLNSRMEEVLSTSALAPNLSSAVLVRLMQEFLAILLLVFAGVGLVDSLWQHHLFRQRNRMSRKEVMDEFRESEGDPHFKSARRQRAQEVATNRMLSDVAKADVIVVNPTHYAIALKWDRRTGKAPVCVAKGVDEIAQRIRERAVEHNVPIHRDPPTARAIHATVEIGQEIRVEHYRAIAAAVRFADAMRKKAAR
jgi:flagellar biosynthesis protein FlhB